jgi:hypothetical protein
MVIQNVLAVRLPQSLGPLAPVQSTDTGGSASSAVHVAASTTPLGTIPWAVWKASTLASVCAPKMPVISCVGIAVARCSCIHRTESSRLPLISSGQLVFGVTLVSGASGAARVLHWLAPVSCQSQKDRPVAP